jgi:hypothetical protein
MSNINNDDFWKHLEDSKKFKEEREVTQKLNDLGLCDVDENGWIINDEE